MEPGKQVEIIGQLIARNVELCIMQKINTSNAFDIGLVDVRDLNEFGNTSAADGARTDVSWKVLSSAVQGGAAVYSLKVDAFRLQAEKLLS